MKMSPTGSRISYIPDNRPCFENAFSQFSGLLTAPFHLVHNTNIFSIGQSNLGYISTAQGIFDSIFIGLQMTILDLPVKRKANRRPYRDASYVYSMMHMSDATPSISIGYSCTRAQKQFRQWIVIEVIELSFSIISRIASFELVGRHFQ